MNRGLARFEKGEYDLAIADFTEAIKGHAAYSEAYDKRGDAHAVKGDQAKAAADRDKAREIRSRRGF
jgi:tetratricopeptide (TPR) repeat protein